ncbi:SpaA isopeptide-forming pilin-related protein [Levilactobacillus paucivorans]|nr:SpaA isopeptide-forming pilin-related protein [Levilactobacillus paucivorans]
MKRKIWTIIFGLVMALTVFLTGGFITNGVTAHAAELMVSGLTGNDPTLTDLQGSKVPLGSELSKWNSYEVNYTWGIPDGESIQAGDTVSVTLPPNAVASQDISVSLKDDSGRVVGTFTIKAGESTGTITFNDVLGESATDRGGHLQFYVTGTSENENLGHDWGVNKVGWIADRNADGSPSKLTWNIAFNPNGMPMGTAVVTDTLGPNQTYVPGSVYAETGKYGEDGGFVADGTVTPEVDAMGNTLIFTFPDVSKAINMTYQTTPNDVSESEIWTNTASMNGQNVTAQITWGGSGSGNGSEQQFGEVLLTKTDRETGAKLAGATYTLEDSNGKIYGSGLVTDANGNISFASLPAGDYKFIETAAPEGYTLDSTPIPFTIVKGETATVDVSAEDTADHNDEEPSGEVILTKVDKATGEKLTGAVYKLVDAEGEVIRTDLITNAEGNIQVDGLAAGDYQFIETKAPEGYTLNETPIAFTIVNGATTAVNVSAEDVATTPGGGGETPGETVPPVTTPPTGPTTPEPEPEPTPEPTPTPTPNPNPTHPTAPKPPVAPTTPTYPGTTTPEPGNTTGSGSQQPVTGGAGNTTPTTGQTSSSHATSTYTGQTLPQTGERSAKPLIVAGLAFLLALTTGGWVVWERRY